MESLKTSLLALGLSEGKASKITRQILNDLAKYQPEQCWQLVSKTITKYPFPVQLAVYKAIYPHYEKMPAPAWFPNWPLMKSTNIARLMAEKGMRDYQHDYRAFHHWTTTHSGDFWQKIAALLNIQFDNHYSAPVDLTKGIENPVWFPGAKLNIVNSCLQAKKNKIAIISQTENSRIKKITYEELDKLSNRVANSLSRRIARGDYVAIVMPMVAESVAIFLGIIKAGGIVVAIPDSFSSEELATRLKISNAKIVFCQDHVIRAGKALPLYQRLLDAAAPQTIVVPAENKLTLQLRGQDIEWDSFLATDDVFMPVSATPQDHINILFSSGTTGEPKIIPWTHITPLKCASDAYFHHNLQADNIFCWPTNLGWMMGPWLIFACLLNKATMALFGGSPNTKSFGQFISDAKVTHLGVVPTMVRTWRHTHCMEGLNWKHIKLFTSSGERSNIEDMLYLMSLTKYNVPIIEYCGGTEVAGAYITGTLLHPSAPAAFTAPALGSDFIILDEEGHRAAKGEAALIPPSIGLSTELLNRDHHHIYFANMPKLQNGKTLRRHGDEIEHCRNGYYRLLGRTDDTMKLSGIKVSSAEIESVLNSLPQVYETAAIAVNKDKGGPTQLIIYAVLKLNTHSTAEQVKIDMQKKLKDNLNPLFKIEDVVIVPSLPRTPSNKVMRKILRAKYLSEKPE